MVFSFHTCGWLSQIIANNYLINQFLYMRKKPNLFCLFANLISGLIEFRDIFFHDIDLFTSPSYSQSTPPISVSSWLKTSLISLIGLLLGNTSNFSSIN